MCVAENRSAALLHLGNKMQKRVKAQKIEGGVFWRQKNFAKKSHSAEKTRKGDPSLSSGSVGYVKKSKKTKRGPFGDKKIRRSRTVPKKIGRGTLLCFPGRPFVSFFLFCTRF